MFNHQIITMKIDRAINFMLITVSVSFLVLTFPYQIIWVADRIFDSHLNKKFNTARDPEFENLKRKLWLYQLVSLSVKDIALILRNLNFSINFFLYSTMSNLFRQELNCIFQSLGLYSFKLFKNELSTSTANSDYVPISSTQSRLFSFLFRRNSDKNTITNCRG